MFVVKYLPSSNEIYKLVYYIWLCAKDSLSVRLTLVITVSHHQARSVYREGLGFEGVFDVSNVVVRKKNTL